MNDIPRRSHYRKLAASYAVWLYVVVTTLFVAIQLLIVGQVEWLRLALTAISAGIIVAATIWPFIYNRLTWDAVKDKNGEILYDRDNVALYNERGELRCYGTIVRCQDMDGRALIRVDNLLNSFVKVWPLNRMQYRATPPTDLDHLTIEYDTELRGNDLYVVDPGKYEGEPLYAVYYHIKALNGHADGTIMANNEDESPLDWFEVTDAERAMFPALADERYVGLWTSQQGFIYMEDGERVEALIKLMEDGDQDIALAA